MVGSPQPFYFHLMIPSTDSVMRQIVTPFEVAIRGYWKKTLYVDLNLVLEYCNAVSAPGFDTLTCQPVLQLELIGWPETVWLSRYNYNTASYQSVSAQHFTPHNYFIVQRKMYRNLFSEIPDIHTEFLPAKYGNFLKFSKVLLSL